MSLWLKLKFGIVSEWMHMYKDSVDKYLLLQPYLCLVSQQMFLCLSVTLDAICCITFLPQPQLTSEWQVKFGMFALEGDPLRLKVYQNERRAAIQPDFNRWTMGWRLRLRTDGDAGLSHCPTVTASFTSISLHTTTVFTPNR